VRVVSAPGQDLEAIFYHWHEFGFRELRRGNLALWNPHIYCGAPFFAGFQPGLLYPPNWLNLVMPTPLAINVGVAFHFVMAGLWTYLWAAYRRLSPAACVLAGLVFMFCGPHFLQVYRGHLPNLRTIAWAPLIFLVVDRVFATRDARWVLLGSAAVALQILSGQVQQTAYTALIVVIYVVLCALRSSRRIASVASVLAVYLAGAALAAVQILSGVAAASDSIRARLPFEIARTFAFPPENLATTVLPGIFGDMIDLPYWGRWTLSETSLFIGVAPLVLTLYGAASGSRDIRRFSVPMAAVALVLAFGAYTPLFRVLYDYVPFFASFRGTTKFTFLAAMFVALLAAIGFDRLLRVTEVPRWPAAIAAAWAVMLLVSALAVRQSSNAGPNGIWTHLLTAIDTSGDAFQYYPVVRSGHFAQMAGAHAALSMAVGGGTFLAVAAMLMAARWQRAFAYVIGVVACAELLLHAHHMLPTFEAAAVQSRISELRDFRDRSAGDFRIQGPNPYVAMSAGVDDVWGYDPTLPNRYAEFVARTQGRVPSDLVTSPLRLIPPVFGIVRLRYVIHTEDGSLQAVRTGFPEAPRATLVSRWRFVGDRAAALDAIMNPDFDPRREVVLEADANRWLAASSAAAVADAGGHSAVRVEDVSTDELEVWAESPQPAVLVLSDGYAAGWEATSMDEGERQSYPVIPADFVLRGIPLPAGRHHLRLEYRPRAFVIGCWVSAISSVAFVLACTLVGLARRRHRAATLDRE